MATDSGTRNASQNHTLWWSTSVDNTMTSKSFVSTWIVSIGLLISHSLFAPADLVAGAGDASIVISKEGPHDHVRSAWIR